MPFEFTNVIKGLVTQTLLYALLERGGYRVTRLGIEELFGEVKHVSMDQYLRLNLPLHLRYLPDLLIAELDMSTVFLVEVKYRRKFTNDSARLLHEELVKRHEYWPDAYTVIMVSEPLPFHPDASFHQDYIRVVRPGDLDILRDPSLTADQRWEKLQHLQRVFKRFNDASSVQDVQKAADTLTQSLKDLAKLV